MKQLLMILLAAGLVILYGCAQKLDGDDMAGHSYTQIDQETAKQMMARDDGYVVVDVRRQDEYDAGHIPGAILIPNESITTEPPEALPELDQIILLYCRTGNRSKQAAQKLYEMGYTNIYEFGGINSWTGEIVTERRAAPAIWTSVEQPVRVRYDRMWEYSDYAESTNPTLITLLTDAIRALEVGAPTDVTVEDYTDLLTFTFQDGSTIRLEFEERNWVTDEGIRYQVEGLSDLRSLLEDMLTSQMADAIRPFGTLVIEANGRTFYATFDNNSSADALREKLSIEPIEIELHDYGNFEKVGALPWQLPQNDVSITTKPGDVILYQGNQITIYYDENTWSFTRLAKIVNVNREELLETLGDGDVDATFSVEWSE